MTKNNTELKFLFHLTRPFMRSMLLIIFFQGTTALSSVSIVIFSKMMIDSAITGLFQKALWSGSIFAILIILQVSVNAVSCIYSTRTNGLILNNLQQKIFKSISQSKWSDYTKYHSEDMMTRLTSDAQLIADGIVSVVPDFISLGVELVAAFVVLFVFDPTLALLAFCLGPLTILFNRLFGHKLKNIHIKVQESESLYRESLHESIQNMLLIKSFSLEESTWNRIWNLQSNRLTWMMQKSKLSVVASSMLSIGYWFGYFLAFCWGAFGLYKGSITFGTMTAFLQLVGQVQVPFVGLAYSYPRVITTLASTSRILEIQSLPIDNTTDSAPALLTAGIEFNTINFSYKENQPILENVSLTIFPGEITALIGSSGIGKTTFIQLLLALLYPKSGHIYLLDDQGKKWEANSSTRSLISYVPQGNTLFSGTISDNLRIGKEQATEDEMIKVCQNMGSWDFIHELPEGINTKVGEKGFGLSEGQSQRIAIARAIIKEAPILILDEATSALDADHEKQILEAIRKLDPKRTCIIITHRTAALSICNRLFKLEENRIVEQSTIANTS